MRLVRPTVLLFAIMLCMVGALAPGQALAHAGPHPAPSVDMRRDIQKQYVVTLAQDEGMTGETGRQCGAQMCCGSACSSGGYVIPSELKLPEPVKVSALIMLPPAMSTKGLGQTGIRRPPRA